MNILIISQYFWPENFRINDITQELVRRGHDVTVLTGLPNYPTGILFSDYRQNPKAFEYYSRSRVVRVPMMMRGTGAVRLALNYLSFAILACLFGPWRLRGQQFDAIFVYEPSPVTVGLPAILLGWLKRSPVVFWVLDLWPETLAAIGTVHSQRLLGWVGYLVRFIYERCTLVLGQSRSFVSSIAKHCSDTQKIRYFPNWMQDIVDEPELVLAPEIPRQVGMFNVLFAGNIGEAQDFSSILDAAESLMRHNMAIRWLIVGDGRRSTWLSEEVARRGLQRNMFLLGRFPIERMPSFYAHADALLVTLKKDPVFSMTIPGKVQSYMGAGVPILGMIDGEGAQIITEASAGLVCSAGDSEGLASAVLELVAMTVDQRNQLGMNGRAYAQREFGRNFLMSRLEALLYEAKDLHRKIKVSA